MPNDPRRSAVAARSASPARLPRTVGSLACWLVLAGALAPSSSARQAPPTSTHYREQLESLGQRQRSQPDALARELDVPAGWLPAGLRDAQLPDKASQPLGECLEGVRAWKVDWLAEAPTPPGEQGDVAEALRHYARGRQALADGNISEAMREFQTASELDPGSTHALAALAQAQLASGRRPQAGVAYRQVLQRDPGDVRALLFVAREAMRDNRWDEGAALAARALDSPEARDDRGMALVVRATLGEALLRLGRFRAARDLFREIGDPPEELAHATSMRVEYAELLRRRGEIALLAGDLSLRLDDYQAADECYELASRLPVLEKGEVLQRRLATLLRQGRSAEAATLVLDAIRSSGGFIDEHQLDLLRRLSSTQVPRELLARILGEIAGDPSRESTPSVRARLIRAQAILDDRAPGMDEMLAALAAKPDDAPLVLGVLDASGRDAPARARSLAALTARFPRHAILYADILLGDGVDIEEILGELRRGAGWGARLALGCLEHRCGRPGQAADALRGVTIPPESLGWARVALVEVSAQAGRWEEALELAARAREDATTPPLALALIERSVQRLDEATRGARRVDAESAGVWELTAAAELLVRDGDVGEASALVARALEVDPFDERGHEASLALHMPGGPAPSPEQVLSTLRTLRDRLPASPLLRTLTARTMVDQGRWGEAWSVLQDLTRERAQPPMVYELMALLAERTRDAGVRSGVVDVLGELSRAHPDAPGPTLARARALAASERVDEALSLLEGAWERFPIVSYARLRERLVRERKGDAKAAAALALSRLERDSSGLERTLELAALRAQGGDYERAAEALSRGIPSGVPLTPGQLGVVLSILDRLPGEADPKSPGSVDRARGVSALFEQAAGSGARLSPPLQIKRVRAAALALKDDPARLHELATGIARDLGEMGSQVMGEVLFVLSRCETPGAMIPFIERHLAQTTPWDASFGRFWAGAVAAHGTMADVDRIPAVFDSSEKLREVVALDGEDTPDADSHDAGVLRAELVYRIAGAAMGEGREEFAIAGYRRCMSMNPGHGFAHNDLGYHLLEKGEVTPEVEALLERAHALLPERASVTDSLGWLRYVQGRLNDTLDERGGVVSRGAISLLREAAESDDALGNDVVTDHYADALWRAGRHEEAKKLWAQAETSLRTQVSFLEEQVEVRGGADEDARRYSPLLAQYKRTLESIRAKLKGAREGGEVPIAPTREERASGGR